MFNFWLYIYVLPAEMGSQIRPKQAVRAKFDEEESDQLEAEKPSAFFTRSEEANCWSSSQESWAICVILQNAIVYCMHMYVSIFFRFRVMPGFFAVVFF